MIVMWNEPIPTIIGSFELQMPKGAKIESVKHARNKFVLYFHANPENEKEIRTFQLINGGEDTKGHKYIDTYIYNTIPFHLYELLI